MTARPEWEPVTPDGVECPGCLGGELHAYTDDPVRGPGSPTTCGRCDGRGWVRAVCCVCRAEVPEGGVLAADYDEMTLRCTECVRRTPAQQQIRGLVAHLEQRAREAGEPTAWGLTEAAGAARATLETVECLERIDARREVRRG